MIFIPIGVPLVQLRSQPCSYLFRCYITWCEAFWVILLISGSNGVKRTSKEMVILHFALFDFEVFEAGWDDFELAWLLSESALRTGALLLSLRLRRILRDLFLRRSIHSIGPVLDAVADWRHHDLRKARGEWLFLLAFVPFHTEVVRVWGHLARELVIPSVCTVRVKRAHLIYDAFNLDICGWLQIYRLHSFFWTIFHPDLVWWLN